VQQWVTIGELVVLLAEMPFDDAARPQPLSLAVAAVVVVVAVSRRDR
jgi:hypothetical protein